LPPVEEIKLRFAGAGGETALGAGVHAIGRDARGTIGVVGDGRDALLRFCVDRRGVWMTVDDAARGVHVNGRPVRRMAMLRVGDTVHVDGAEVMLVGKPALDMPAKLGNTPVEAGIDPRVVLRGVGGRYHGRSFTLERPRLVGRAADADIRIDDGAFADRHARIDMSQDVIVLRDLGSAEGSIVNGEPVRDAVLRPGDQIVFDAHHRFVVEAPARAMGQAGAPELSDDENRELPSPQGSGRSGRRLPWLLLAALLIAMALSALLLFGVQA
jgi:pSer/pThr/pTyr-binding forkhead associated (FHA) protein